MSGRPTKKPKVKHDNWDEEARMLPQGAENTPTTERMSVAALVTRLAADTADTAVPAQPKPLPPHRVAGQMTVSELVSTLGEDGVDATPPTRAAPLPASRVAGQMSVTELVATLAADAGDDPAPIYQRSEAEQGNAYPFTPATQAVEQRWGDTHRDHVLYASRDLAPDPFVHFLDGYDESSLDSYEDGDEPLFDPVPRLYPRVPIEQPGQHAPVPIDEAAASDASVTPSELEFESEPDVASYPQIPADHPNESLPQAAVGANDDIVSWVVTVLNASVPEDEPDYAGMDDALLEEVYFLEAFQGEMDPDTFQVLLDEEMPAMTPGTHDESAVSPATTLPADEERHNATSDFSVTDDVSAEEATAVTLSPRHTAEDDDTDDDESDDEGKDDGRSGDKRGDDKSDDDEGGCGGTQGSDSNGSSSSDDKHNGGGNMRDGDEGDKRDGNKGDNPDGDLGPISTATRNASRANDTPTSGAPVLIDLNYYPHIQDTITLMAGGAGLTRLRGVSRELRTLCDRRLKDHVIVWGDDRVTYGDMTPLIDGWDKSSAGWVRYVDYFAAQKTCPWSLDMCNAARAKGAKPPSSCLCNGCNSAFYTRQEQCAHLKPELLRISKDVTAELTHGADWTALYIPLHSIKGVPLKQPTTNLVMSFGCREGAIAAPMPIYSVFSYAPTTWVMFSSIPDADDGSGQVAPNPELQLLRIMVMLRNILLSAMRAKECRELLLVDVEAWGSLWGQPNVESLFLLESLICRLGGGWNSQTHVCTLNCALARRRDFVPCGSCKIKLVGMDELRRRAGDDQFNRIISGRRNFFEHSDGVLADA